MMSYQPKISTPKIQPSQRQFKAIENYQYNLIDVIGHGFSCIVYKGLNNLTKEIVAIKVVEHKSMSEQMSSMLLTNEIENLKRLKSENILKLHDVFRTINNTYIVTEYCNQGDLGGYIKQHGALKEEPALKVLKHVLNGLKELQRHGIAHRDLKPDNILLKDGTPKIADFGFAKSLEQINKNAGREMNVGTPIYMSPETLQNNEYSDKTDIWALGVMYYELIFGEVPWQVTNVQELMHKIFNVKITFPLLFPISELSKDLILRTIRIDPMQRMNLDDIFKHPLIKKPKLLTEANNSYHNSPQIRIGNQARSEHTTPVPARFAGRSQQHRPSHEPIDVVKCEKKLKGITMRALVSPSQTHNYSNTWIRKIDKVLQSFLDLCAFMRKVYLQLDTPEMFACPQMMNKLKFATVKNIMIIISRLREQIYEDSGRKNTMQLLSWRAFTDTPDFLKHKNEVDDLFPQYQRLFLTVYESLNQNTAFKEELDNDQELFQIFDKNFFQFPSFYMVVIQYLKESVRDINNKLLLQLKPEWIPKYYQNYLNTLEILLSYYELIKFLRNNLSDPYNFADEAQQYTRQNGQVLTTSQSQYDQLRRKIKTLVQ